MDFRSLCSSVIPFVSASLLIQSVGSIDLSPSVSFSLRDVVLKLLQFEASTNLADSKGCFPLHLAAWRGDVDIVRILIHHGHSHCRVNQQVNTVISSSSS